jgi:DNA-binding CsgD family transcriptional regulator
MKSAYFRYYPHTRTFRVSATHGLTEAFAERLAESASKLGEERGLVGLVGARGEAIYVPNVRSDPRWAADDPNVRSAYFTPISAGAGDGLLGVLGLFATEADAFSSAHRGLADAYAREVGRGWYVRERAADPEGNTSLREAVSSVFSTGDVIPRGDGPARVDSELDSELDLGQLSERERDVVLAMCRGLRLAEIARVLGISHHTARNHLKRVFKKLGVHSQVELLVILGGQRRRSGAA